MEWIVYYSKIIIELLLYLGPTLDKQIYRDKSDISPMIQKSHNQMGNFQVIPLYFFIGSFDSLREVEKWYLHVWQS